MRCNYIELYNLGWWLPEKEHLLNADFGMTNTEPHPTLKDLKVWNGVQTINQMFDVNVFSYVQLATFAMPALARSGAASKVLFLIQV